MSWSTSALRSLVSAIAVTTTALAAISLGGCGALLGTEDVELDGAGGAGGAGTSVADVTSGIGAGLPVGPAATSSADASGSTATWSSSDAASSSTSTGGGCEAALPPCPGAAPDDFDQDGEPGGGWDVAQPKAENHNGRLELEPDDAPWAGVVSTAPVNVAPASGACGVWFALLELDRDLAVGLGIGPGEPAADAYRIERRGSSVVASVSGVEVAAVPFVQESMRYLRLSFDGPSTVGFETSPDGVCWTPVAAPQTSIVAQGLARLYAEGDGKARVDDFCR